MKKFIFVGLVLTILLTGSCTQEKLAKEYCTKKETNEKLSLSEAKEIAMNSECAQGELKENYLCNQYTGTWWIDLDIEAREICNPACVINVVTKKASINWRCTGAIP